LRLVLNLNRDNIGGRLIGNYQTTSHYQQDTNYKPLVTLPNEKYAQELMSLGAEFDISIKEKLRISLGSSYDHFKTPISGDKNPQPNLSDWASNINFEWKPEGSFYAIFSLGKRTRFPTLRELYGVALDKFIINPNLRPETAILADLTFSWFPEESPASITTTFWTTKISDAISKRQVIENNNRYDQRYNISGSKGKGFSFEATYLFSDKLQMQLNGNLQSNEADIGKDDLRPPILMQPEVQLNLVVDYDFSEQLTSRLSIQKIDGAIDEGLDGKIVELGSSNRIDVNFFINIIDNWKVYIALNNINDAIILPQLGFPDSGREYKIGFERLL
jgi:iron complex outermembrane receptor protein